MGSDRAERHVLVPVEPTEAMIEAGSFAWAKHNHGSPYTREIPDIYRTMLAAAPAAPPVQMEAVAWQPIETAPKDSTEVIVLMGLKDIRLGWYFAPSSTTRRWLDQNGKSIHPTHWMPLPSAPETET